jgi:hypothetical protein
LQSDSGVSYIPFGLGGFGNRSEGARISRFRFQISVGLGCLLAIAGTAAAQQGQRQQLERFDRQMEQIQRETRVRADQSVPADQRALIDYGAYMSAQFVSIDDPEQRSHLLQQYDLVVYARVNVDGAHEFYGRVRTTYRAFREGESFDGNDNDWVEPTLDRGYYRFDLARYLSSSSGQVIDGDLAIQAGRQLVVWGNGLVLSEELDGGIVDFTAGPLTLEVLAGQTRESIFDIDPSRPGFDGDTKRAFYGGMLSAQLGKQRPYVYFVKQNDLNDDTVLNDGGTPPSVTRFEYESYYIGIGSTGDLSDNLLYSVEVAYEGGSNLSNAFPGAAQTEDNINAYAADVRLDYLLNDRRNTRFSGEGILASGDSDRQSSSTETVGGNQPGTSDKAFNSFGLLNTGLAFAPSVTNLAALRVGASTYPWSDVQALRRLQTGVDFFVYGKLNPNAPIDEPTHKGDAWLGSEFDFYANWQLTSDLSLQARYGIFLPGSSPSNDRDPRHFVLLGVTYAF